MMFWIKAERYLLNINPKMFRFRCIFFGMGWADCNVNITKFMHDLFHDEALLLLKLWAQLPLLKCLNTIHVVKRAGLCCQGYLI
jgi:hypothetical protein